MHNTYIFELIMSVRDYECDLQGIVNNANYLHYMEHTRHQFLLSENVSFVELHNQGIDCVVARLNISYKSPLRSNDRFFSCLYLRKDGLRYVFYQDILSFPDRKLIAKAQIDVVCIVNGKLGSCVFLDRNFVKYWELD